MTTAPAAADRPAPRPRRRWLAPLIVATAANYGWQIPYAIHQYGSRWLVLPGLSVPLLATGVWFTVGAVLFVRGHRRGRLVLGAFLLTEAAFYLVHNLSGAFLADLPRANPVVLVASVLGYANIVAAIGYLAALVTGRPRPAEGPAPEDLRRLAQLSVTGRADRLRTRRLPRQ